MYAREVFVGEIAKNMSRRHLKKKTATEFLEYCCSVMPADAVRNVIHQITRNQFFGMHGARRHISNVNQLRLS